MYLRKTTKDVDGVLSRRVPIGDIEIFLYILLRSATKLRGYHGETGSFE